MLGTLFLKIENQKKVLEDRRLRQEFRIDEKGRDLRGICGADGISQQGNRGGGRREGRGEERAARSEGEVCHQ